MRILLNGLELPRRAEGPQAAGDVLRELQQEINEGGKVITQVMLDGQPLPSGWQAKQLLARSAAQFDRLDLTIEAPGPLKQRTLADAAQLVEQLTQKCKPLSKKFRLGDEVVANNELAAYLDDLKLIVSGLDHSTRPTRGIASPEPVRTRMMTAANTLIPSLDRIYKAQAAGDYIAIADEIEYELSGQLPVWGEILREAQSYVNDSANLS